MPSPEMNVTGSAKTSAPRSVATIGSTVASIAARLGSIYVSPRVYAANGMTAVISPASTVSPASRHMLSAAVSFAAVSDGSQMSHAPRAAMTKVYVVTVSALYFFSATEPRMLYSPYPMPEHSPTISPRTVMLPPPIPETSTHPTNEHASAASFRAVSRSLKSRHDISITHIGEVYSSIAAVESVIMLIAEK